MKSKYIILFLLICFTLLACTKNRDKDMPPGTRVGGIDSPIVAPVDTLGLGWQSIKVDTAPALSDVFFVDNQTGFICGNRYLGKSSDGGLTWTRCLPDSLSTDFINIFFVDQSNGWVTGKNFLLKTADGGISWQRIILSRTFDVQMLDADNGYITTENSGVYKTNNGGITFQFLPKASPGGGLFFSDINHGWFSNALGLFATNNGCADVVKKQATITGNPYVVQFTDSLHGWLAGYGGIYRTVDGGLTLEKLADSNEGADIQFFNNNTGYMMTGDAVYATTDGGKSKSLVCKMPGKKLVECHFTDINHGWATGLAGYLYRYVKP